MLDRCEHCGRVYSDHDHPREPAADRCPVCHGRLASPLTVEERFAVLERSVARLRRRPDPPAAGLGWWLLTFGQVVSVLACAAVVAGVAWFVTYLQPRARTDYDTVAQEQVSQRPELQEPVRAFPDRTLEILIGAATAAAYSAAMYVVFTRVKRLSGP